MAGKRGRPKRRGYGSSDVGTVEEKAAGEYEQLREQRIRENKERMQRLGILDLSLKLKSQRPPSRRVPRNVSPNTKTHLPVHVSDSPRRSSRLKTLDPVCYSELRPKRGKNSSKSGEICLREGSEPEIYTEEHEKLLGDCKTSWTLSVDGCGSDGKRIYDPDNGKTCHQCRQKTLGHHTRCSKCNLVQGQFCGDCLYMRYGENVIEASQNLDWICPVCRGICNCSLCRQAKGWAPTGSLYRKVINLGFKSVAHYLIQNRRSQLNSDVDSGVQLLDSAAGLLTFEDNESLDVDKNNDEPQFDNYEDVKEGEDRESLHSLQIVLDIDKDSDEPQVDYEDAKEGQDGKHADLHVKCGGPDPQFMEYGGEKDEEDNPCQGEDTQPTEHRDKKVEVDVIDFNRKCGSQDPQPIKFVDEKEEEDEKLVDFNGECGREDPQSIEFGDEKEEEDSKLV